MPGTGPELELIADEAIAAPVAVCHDSVLVRSAGETRWPSRRWPDAVRSLA